METLIMWIRRFSLVIIVVVAGCTTDGGTDNTDTASAANSTTSTPTLLTSTTVAPTTSATTVTSTSTSTLPEPPTLEIADPASGTTVTDRVYTFRGLTDPGCTVDVGGKYFADVDSDGNWTLELILVPGGNTTTFTATDEAGNATQTTASVVYGPPLVLETDGLGVVDFGDPIEDVMRALAELLGPPEQMPGYQNSGGWPFLTIYAATEPPGGEGPLLFHGWMTDLSVWSTHEGVGPGSTVDEFRAAYGEAIVFAPDPCDPTGEAICSFWITKNGGGLQGVTSGTDPDSVITIMDASG